MGSAATHGNAAKIALAESGPVPAPGVILQGLKWMLKPDSPLYSQALAGTEFRQVHGVDGASLQRA